MFWRVVHDACKWLGISFFPALFAFWMGALAWVDQYPDNKPWLAQVYRSLEQAMHTPAFWAIAVVTFLVWLIALMYSGHKAGGRDRKTDFAGLAELLREFRRDDPVKTEPESTTQDITTGTIQALEQSDVMESTAEVFPPTVRAVSPLYVGQIIISAAQLADGSLEIAIRAFNGSSETIALASVHGAISGSINNATGDPLPTPTLRPGFVDAPIQPLSEFMVVLDQPLPGPSAQTYLDALNRGDYIALDLRELRLVMRAEDDANLTAPLPLWDGATIRRRDDIFTGRITMVSVTGLSLTLNASGTLTDANNAK
jgi:hypothetical protein